MSTRDAVDSRIPGADWEETAAREAPDQRRKRTEYNFCTRRRQVVSQSGALGCLVQKEERHGNQTRTGQEVDQSHDNYRRGRELTGLTVGPSGSLTPRVGQGDGHGPSVVLNRKQLQTRFTSYISLRFPPKRRRKSDLTEHRPAELRCSVQDTAGPRGVSQINRIIPQPELSVEPVSHLLSLEKTSHPVQDDVATPPTGSGYLTLDQRHTPCLAFGQQRQTTDNGTTDTGLAAVETQSLEPPTTDTQQLQPTDTQKCQPTAIKSAIDSVIPCVSSELANLERLDSRGSDTPVAATACTSSPGVDDCLGKGSVRVVTGNYPDLNSSGVPSLPAAMLSSTVVSVLATNWATRRRQKKAEQEAQGSQQEVIEGGWLSSLRNTREVTSKTMREPAGERGDTPGSPSQWRAPSLGRRGTLSSHGDSTSPVSPIYSSMVSQTDALPLSREQHAQQGISQAGRYGDQLSFLSSKPKTSSLLLSLRRVNSAGPTHSNTAPPTMFRSINDRAAGSSVPQSSSASTNDGERERSKSLLSSSSTPYRTKERSWPHHISTSPNQREADTSTSRLFSTSPNHKEPEAASFSNPSMTSRVYPTPSYFPKHTTLSSGLKRMSSTDLELTKEDNLTSSRMSDFLTRPLPRSTQLDSSSWSKNVTKDQSFSNSSSPLRPTNNLNNKISENKNNMFPSSDYSNKTVQGIHANINSTQNPQSTNNTNNYLSQLGHHGNLGKFPDSCANTPPLRQTVTPQEPGDQHAHASHAHTSPTQPTDTHPSHTHAPFQSHQDLSPTNTPGQTLDQKPRSLSNVYYSTRMSSALRPTTFSCSTVNLSRTEPGLDRGHGGEHLTHSLGSQLRSHNPGPLFSSSPASSSSPPVPSRYAPRPCSFIPFSSGPVSTSLCSTSTDPSPSSGSSSSSTPQPFLPYHTTPTNTNTTSQPFFPNNSHPPSLSPNTSHTPNTPPSPPDFPLSPHISLTQGMKLASWATWQDSVELHGGETTTRGQRFPPGSPPVLTSPLSPPSRRHHSVEGPSIFASLRSGSPSWATSPRSPPAARSSSLSVWRGGRETQGPSHSFLDSAGKTEGEEGETEREGREKEGRKKEDKVSAGSSLKFTFDHTRDGGTIPQRKFPKESTSSSASNAPLSLQSDFGSRSSKFSPPPYQTLKANSPSRTSPTSPTTYLSKSPSKSLSPSPPCTFPISPPISPYSPILAHKRTSSWDRSNDVVTENNRANNSHNTAQIIQDCVALHLLRTETHVDDITSPSPAPFLSANVDKPLPPSARVTVVETLVYRIPSCSSSSKDGIQLTHSYSSLQAPCTVISNSDPLQIAHRRQLTGGIICQSQQSSNDSNALGQQCPPTGQIKGNLLERTDKGWRAREIPVTEKKSEREWRERDSPPEAPPPSQGNRRGLFRNKKERTASITPAATLARGRETAQTERDKREKRDVERREGEAERGERGHERDKRGLTKMDLVLQRLKQTFNIKWPNDELPSRRKRTSPPTSDPSTAPGTEVTSVTSNRGHGQGRDGISSLHSSLAQGSRGEGGGEGGRGGVCVQTDRERTGPDIPPEGTGTGHSQFGVLRGQVGDHNRHWSSMIDLSHPDPHRSPLSSPSSPLSRKDRGGDSVFYSPTLQPRWGRKKATSLCESGEGEFKGQESEVRGQGAVLASCSSYADLKYGLAAGRSISVSSVMSSRPFGPGRISTGPGMVSVSDLTDPDDPAVTSRGVATWVDHSGAGKGDWLMSNRSGFRSLPRYRTRGLEVTSPGQVRSTSLDTSHFLWESEGPPTPPLTPPSRRMSRSPSTSPSSPPCSAGGGVSPESQASRGRLPSRGYVSSLSAFEESDADSNASSDTTTDDEYYLGDGDAEKETEL
ncbi:serine-rich adhesin for platelets-like isoform X2 [Hypomesus transpacificus]|uniref:serine-rich adhesin for platelets-like isoform X2 n=1 Tax=Hypomesus transpacificus TaxID=137520 RepID=UPI001F0841A4|nr:serine-rich adhesin for platelets-like isoform X2 [Hypomesus transpacificus]